MKIESANTYQLLHKYRTQLTDLRQLDLIGESKFLSWARDLKLGTFGVVTGDVGEFWRRGWLRSDEICLRPADRKIRYRRLAENHWDERRIGDPFTFVDADKHVEALFHPFRIYPARKIVGYLSLDWAASSMLIDTFPEHCAKSVIATQKSVRAGAMTPPSDRANAIADLAILAEPLYFPWITSVFRGRSFVENDELEPKRIAFGDEVMALFRKMSFEDLAEAHKTLRLDALSLDQNIQIYMLLRAANWDTRQRVKGHLGLALWIRHIAEVLRRATEEAHGQLLPEEDEGHTHWREGGREAAYGSVRSLDFPTYYRKDLLQNMGLEPSVRTRWYVEGETEYGYLKAALGNIRECQAEAVNRKGRFNGKGAEDLWVEMRRDALAERFTMVTADRDEPNNFKAVQRMAAEGLIVGFVSINDPDFEWANFTLDELIEAAVNFDRTADEPAESEQALTGGDWEGVKSGKDFAARYVELHEHRRRGPKGERFGRILWEITKDSPKRPDGRERPISNAIYAAENAHKVDYRYERDNYKTDPVTLLNVPIAAGSASQT